MVSKLYKFYSFKFLYKVEIQFILQEDLMSKNLKLKYKILNFHLLNYIIVT